GLAGRGPAIPDAPFRTRLSTSRLRPALLWRAEPPPWRPLARRARAGTPAVLERRAVRADHARAAPRAGAVEQRRVARRVRRAVRAVSLLGARVRGGGLRRAGHAGPGVRGSDGPGGAQAQRQLLHTREPGARAGARRPRGD